MQASQLLPTFGGMCTTLLRSQQSQHLFISSLSTASKEISPFGINGNPFQQPQKKFLSLE
jgi:hypothetical protein